MPVIIQTHAGRPRRVTARDVAQRAGVSQSTVSYVLNDTPGQSIPKATRDKVRQAAVDLGYTPSAAARTLRRGASESVLMVLPDAPIGEAIALAIEGVAHVLEPHGYTVVYRRQHNGQSLTKLWHELMPAAIASLVGAPLDERKAIEASGIPLVEVTLGDDLDDDRPVSIPQHSVGRCQAEHLVLHGHRQLGYAASIDPLVTRYLEPRLEGVRAVCATAHLPEPVVVPVTLDVASGTSAVDRWRSVGVTAVAAYNDEIAFAVLAGLHERALGSPTDLAVIGVDNIPLGRLSQPPLTTIDMHSGVAGQDIARVLLHRLQPEITLDGPIHRLTLELIQRSTT